MKLLADENIEGEIVAALRDAGLMSLTSRK